MSSAAESKPETNVGGRPPYVPTDKDRKIVESMAGYGIPQVDIAAVIGVSGPTLRKHFRHEIRTASARACAKVAECLHMRATDMRSARNGGSPQASVTAAIWWEKTRGGRSDRVHTELTGANGGPVQVSGPVIMLPPESED